VSPHIQTGYVRAVLRLTHFLERSPDTATAADLSRFQVHLAQTLPVVRSMARSRSTNSPPAATLSVRNRLARTPAMVIKQIVRRNELHGSDALGEARCHPPTLVQE
jgi:hypothetical protein